MPDEEPEPEVDWSQEDPPAETAEAETAHDDIMKRLLDYQRSLREGATPEEAAEAMKRGITDPSLLEASTAAEGLAELLSTEVVPDEAPAVEPEPEVEPEAQAEPELELSPSAESALAPAPEDAPESETSPETVAEPSITDGELEAVGGSRSELQAKVGRLEGQLEGIGAKIAELRRNFQDMAVAADERLASMADEVEQATREEPE